MNLRVEDTRRFGIGKREGAWLRVKAKGRAGICWRLFSFACPNSHLKGMASTDTAATKPLDKSSQISQNGSVEKIAESLGKVSLQNDDTKSSPDKKDESPRLLHVYARPQILQLSKSPLVKQPDGMPALKEWFGCVSNGTMQCLWFLNTLSGIGMNSS